jgi:hypothetical protein
MIGVACAYVGHCTSYVRVMLFHFIELITLSVLHSCDIALSNDLVRSIPNTSDSQ